MKRAAAILAIATTAVLVAAPAANAASVSPTSKDYGSQNVGTTGAATSFTLQTSSNTCVMNPMNPAFCLSGTETSYSTNTAALGVAPGGTVTIDDFVIHNVNCQYPTFPSPPVIVPPSGASGSCTFEVSFAPVATGARSKTLTFTDTGGPAATLTLTGTGIPPASTTPTTTPTPTTPQKKKKCKKKHRAAAAKKCKKKR